MSYLPPSSLPPPQVNGVPARRVNQAYVIATSTKVDVAGVDTAKFTDAYFKKAERVRSKKNEEGFFAEAPAKEALPKASILGGFLGNRDDEMKGGMTYSYSISQYTAHA